jgi:hypothetical protein
MNINGTNNKLALAKTTVRELNQAEWELVGGGSFGETFSCYTYTCGPTYSCPATNGCPSNTCPATYTCPTGTCPAK